MKAIEFNKAGDPKEVLTLGEKEMPPPKGKEVLVRVLGSPIQPADYLFVQGRYRYKPQFPQIAGIEGAGIVETPGENAKLQPGTLVAFMHLKAWAEYIVVPEEELIVLPKDFPTDKAIQFCANPFTAWGLLEESKAKPGDWLLLTAGNSSVSGITIQLAALRNLRTIAVIRDMRQAEEIKTLGAKEVLDMEDDSFIEKVMAITEGKGVAAALDAVGGKAGTHILQCMAANGRVIIYGLLSNQPVQFYNEQIIFKNLIIKGFGIRGFLGGLASTEKEEMINVLTNEIATDSFSLPVANAYSLDRFNEALIENERGNGKGKIILRI